MVTKKTARELEWERKWKAEKALAERIESVAGDYVRFDAPHGWAERLASDEVVTASMTDEDIVREVIDWATTHDVYCDPDETEDDDDGRCGGCSNCLGGEEP